MATVVLLVVHHGRADLLIGPQSVLRVSQLVVFTHKHGDWNRADRVNRNQVSLPLRSDVQESMVVRSPNLESCFLQVLSVVQKSLHSTAIRLMVHVHLKSILIIVLGVVTDEETLKGEAEWG